MSTPKSSILLLSFAVLVLVIVGCDGGSGSKRPTTSDIVVTGKENMPDEPGIYDISDDWKPGLPEYTWDTAQLLIHENGNKEIIWDREAALKRDDPRTGLPFCETLPKTSEGEQSDPKAEDLSPRPDCIIMSDGIALGPR